MSNIVQKDFQKLAQQMQADRVIVPMPEFNEEAFDALQLELWAEVRDHLALNTEVLEDVEDGQVIHYVDFDKVIDQLSDMYNLETR